LGRCSDNLGTTVRLRGLF